MAEDRDIKSGEIVRRNRRIARIQRITREKIHLRILQDVTFRVYDSEIIDREGALLLLRRFPQGFYSCILFKSPEKIEGYREGETQKLMSLILEEHESPFGKREFKQILVKDDGLLKDEEWNRFWNAAYREMRASDRFLVDEKGRYSLA